MENEKANYPRWFLQLAQDMLNMRDAQRDYFAGPTNSKLKTAKVFEQKADAWLARMVTASLIQHRGNRENNQQNLFSK